MSTDAQRAGMELRELERQVHVAFADPASVEPAIADGHRRPRLRLWLRPGFGNHLCWCVWGSSTNRGLVRRIEWRRDLDIARADPIRRLALLGDALRATLEVRDGEIDVGVIAPPPAVDLSGVLQAGRAIHLDGAWYGAEMDNGSLVSRLEWFGVDEDWMPAQRSLLPVASWAVEVQVQLDRVIER